jgi:hypothetical protein
LKKSHFFSPDPLPAASDPIKAALMLIQQWMRWGGTPRKKSPNLPQKKPGSHNKWEMVDSPLPSSSAPYPTGTQIFLAGTGTSEHKASAQDDSGETGEDGNIISPPQMVGKYRAQDLMWLSG